MQLRLAALIRRAAHENTASAASNVGLLLGSASGGAAAVMLLRALNISQVGLHNKVPHAAVPDGRPRAEPPCCWRVIHLPTQEGPLQL